MEKQYSDPSASRWVFKAIVYNSTRSRGFIGYGDADPSNVSIARYTGAGCALPKPAPSTAPCAKGIRHRALLGRGLGWALSRATPETTRSAPTPPQHLHNGQPRLRDRLCLLIRQHQLDAGLVKAHAADYCGTATLREASRDLVEAFINDLAERAAKDRDGLICQLNSYAAQPEVGS